MPALHVTERKPLGCGQQGPRASRLSPEAGGGITFQSFDAILKSGTVEPVRLLKALVENFSSSRPPRRQPIIPGVRGEER